MKYPSQWKPLHLNSIRQEYNPDCAGSGPRRRENALPRGPLRTGPCWFCRYKGRRPQVLYPPQGWTPRRISEFRASRRRRRPNHIYAILDAEHETVEWQRVNLSDPLVHFPGGRHRGIRRHGGNPDPRLIGIAQAAQHVSHDFRGFDFARDVPEPIAWIHWKKDPHDGRHRPGRRWLFITSTMDAVQRLMTPVKEFSMNCRTICASISFP